MIYTVHYNIIPHATLTAQFIALVHTCPQPLKQHFLPEPHRAPTGQLSTQIPNLAGLGHTTTHGKGTQLTYIKIHNINTILY